MITLGTVFATLFRGKLVGVDEFGNRYYCDPGRKRYGRERRWVVYKGEAEASKVPPEWHAWLHHTSPVPLAESAATGPAWHKPHVANTTGTVAAYRPRGHDLRGGQRRAIYGEYTPWMPEEGGGAS